MLQRKAGFENLGWVALLALLEAQGTPHDFILKL